MTPEEADDAEVMGRIRKAEEIGATVLNLSGLGSLKEQCCKFVVEAKICVNDRQFSSPQRTDRE
jgi:hypothetical protein